MKSVRRIVALMIVVSLVPCGELVRSAQAATSATSTKPDKVPTTYRASKSPNLEEARRVVANLGVGEHVAVKLTSGKTVRGHIDAIAADHFVLLLDGAGGATDIAYGDVKRLGPNPGTTATLIIVAVVIAAAVVVLAIAVNSAADKLIGTLKQGTLSRD